MMNNQPSEMATKRKPPLKKVKTISIFKSYYTRSTRPHINKLPEEMVQKIFSYLSAPDLCKASLVSRRWARTATTPRLWRYLKIHRNMSTAVALKCLKMARDVKELTIIGRRDAGLLIEHICKNNKRIENLTIERCHGFHYRIALPSATLCKFLRNSPLLGKLTVRHCKIISCKFFKLLGQRGISERSADKPYEAVFYNGPMSRRQVTHYIAGHRECSSFTVRAVHVNNDTVVFDLRKLEDSEDKQNSIDVQALINTHM